ncbi:MAG: type II toxin-antitoxin system HicB family antitoxin [Gemmataceae bacterium]
MKYLVIIEKGPSSYGGYVPDLPGCVAVGATKREVKSLIREAIRLHLKDMRERGEPIPKPNAASKMIQLEPV